MTTRRPDPETVAAIQAHWDARHTGELTEDQIALEQKGNLAGATKVTFTPETRQSPAWFTCLECPKGVGRYRVDVRADPVYPPKRHVEAIRRHFREVHGVELLAEECIYRDSSSPARAIYGPSTPLRGAHMICLECPEASKHIILEDPPYGDARSFSELTMQEPGLARRLARLSLVDRAGQLEAHHRGINAEASQPAIDRALNKARRGPPRRKLTETQQGIQRLLLSEVRAGTGVTSAITELAAMARADRVAYAGHVASAIPSMERFLWNPPERVAELLIQFCGRPATTDRAIWAIWERIPEAERRSAQEGDTGASERTTLQ